MATTALWPRQRISRVCALGEAATLDRLAAAIVANAATVVPLQEPLTELVLMETADPVEGGSFYLGEVLVTSALLEVDGRVGVAVVVGDEPERARAAAAIDAAMQVPGVDWLAEELAAEERALAERERREWALVARTRVRFETMEDRDPGATRSTV